MRIWIDVDNAPHVQVMRPIAAALEERGHKIVLTARDRGRTCPLLDLYGFNYEVHYGEFGGSKTKKVIGTISRAISLAKSMRNRQIDVSFGHSSRSQPIASWLLGIPSITMYDYEWINPTIYNLFCKQILLPDCIDEGRVAEAGIRISKVQFFPGFKEMVYLSDEEFSPRIYKDLGLDKDKIKILIRPPASLAHYHNIISEEILDALIERLSKLSNVQIIWLSRYDWQMDLIPASSTAQFIVPRKALPGPQLIMAMDVVIGGGGTMTREAAILGVPSYSFFGGRIGLVDETLASEGRLKMLKEPKHIDCIAIESRKATHMQSTSEGNTLESILRIVENS